MDSKAQINLAFKEAEKELCELLRKNGGIITTFPFKKDKKGYIKLSFEHDTIYGYTLDYDSSYPIDEKYVYAVRLNEEDNSIDVYLANQMRTYIEEYEPDNEENWYRLDGGLVFYQPTLYNIIDAIEQHI